MKRLQLNQDVLAGIMFAAFGAFFIYFGRNYSMGSAVRMGPGYVPHYLGWLLVAVGAVIGIKGAVAGGPQLERWAVRPLVLVAGALVIFAFLIQSLGLIATAVIAMLVAAFGGMEFKWREQLVLAVAFAAVCAVGFIYFLGLPMRYLPQFVGLGY